MKYPLILLGWAFLALTLVLPYAWFLCTSGPNMKRYYYHDDEVMKWAGACLLLGLISFCLGGLVKEPRI